MPGKKKTMSVRSQNGQPKKHSASQATLTKRKKKVPRRKKVTSFGAPAPLVKIITPPPGSVAVPSNLTVKAVCRLGSITQVCSAWLLDTSTPPVDIQPGTGPGTDPNNPQFTFNLTVPMKTYALEVFIMDSGKVVTSDGQTVST